MINCGEWGVVRGDERGGQGAVRTGVGVGVCEGCGVCEGGVGCKGGEGGKGVRGVWEVRKRKGVRRKGLAKRERDNKIERREEKRISCGRVHARAENNK